MGRSRHCGYCYDAGHNRATCEKMTANIKRLATDPNMPPYTRRHYAELYAKRAGETVEGEPFEKPKRYRRRSRRQCSWCKNGGYDGDGHNRRTCERRHAWLAMKNRENKAYRYAIQERAKALKIGVGSLIQSTDWFYDKEGNYTQHKIVGMIEKIDWSQVVIDDPGVPVMTVHWLNAAADFYNVRNGLGARKGHCLISALISDDRRWANPDYGSTTVIGYSTKPLAGCPDDWESEKLSKFVSEPF